MRKILLLACLFVSMATFGQGRFTQSYNGNEKSSFGGAIGGGMLSVTDTPDSLIFSLHKGAGPFDSILVIYLDVVDNTGASTHIASTSELPGYTDPYQVAISGATTTAGQRAVLNFPSGFHPNAAVALNNQGGIVYYFVNFGITFLFKGASFDITPSGTSSAADYTVGAKKADLKIGANPTFKFLATYIGPNASRSDEAFGDPFTNYERVARTASYNTYNVTNFLSFASTLPVKLTDFKAAKERDGVNLTWSVAQESGIEAYEIQRSGNGIQFSTIKTVGARNATASVSYTIKDGAPNATGSYYRLAVRENGKYEYSKVVYIGGNKGKGSLVVNYQSGNGLRLTLNDVAAGTYRLSVVNNSGQVLHTATLQHNGSNGNEQLNLQSGLAKGIYRVVLQSPNEKYTAAILVQ